MLLLSFQLAPAFGYELFPGKWPNATTVMYVSIPGANGLWNTAFEGAMNQWSQDTIFSYSILRGQYADPCSDPNVHFKKKNGVAFSATDCGLSWGSGVLAVTSVWTNPPSVITQAGVIFNSNEVWDVYAGPRVPSAVDFRRVAVHELGHVLGLGHEAVVPAIMAAYISDIENPTADDIAGVSAKYGPPVPLDTDADGISDSADNCINVANGTLLPDAGGQSQRDTDGDGYGNICDPDFNNNGIVDSQDGALLKAAFGSPAFPDRDLNGNGVVDSNDGARLKASFGQPPGPAAGRP